MNKQIIIANKEIAKKVFLLSFKKDFDFIPGQVIGISKDTTDAPRLYSIASGNKDPEIGILYDIKEGGTLTPWLAKLKSGDVIYTTKASGNFISEAKEEAYWIAAGTGIAPFVSMLFSGNYANKTLIHGGRFIESFYFSEIITGILDRKYIRCCTMENGENIYNGRLTKYLKDMDNLNPDCKYYLCGSAEMVVETRDILLSKKIPFKNIIAEIYF